MDSLTIKMALLLTGVHTSVVEFTPINIIVAALLAAEEK
jgi:hypothetical protein